MPFANQEPRSVWRTNDLESIYSRRTSRLLSLPCIASFNVASRETPQNIDRAGAIESTIVHISTHTVDRGSCRKPGVPRRAANEENRTWSRKCFQGRELMRTRISNRAIATIQAISWAAIVIVMGMFLTVIGASITECLANPR